MKKNVKKNNSFKEKLNEFANRLRFSLNETEDKWIFTKGRLQISMKKSRSESVDARRAEVVLNEGMTDLPSAGFYGTSTGHPYCEYKILPLTSNLEQKLKKKEKKGDIIQIGNYVVGKDEKGDIYHGKIQKFNRDVYNDIKSVVVLAKENGRLITLVPKTVNISDPYPESKGRRGFGLGGSSIQSIGSCQGGFSV